MILFILSPSRLTSTQRSSIHSSYTDKAGPRAVRKSRCISLVWNARNCKSAIFVSLWFHAKNQNWAIPPPMLLRRTWFPNRQQPLVSICPHLSSYTTTILMETRQAYTTNNHIISNILNRWITYDRVGTEEGTSVVNNNINSSSRSSIYLRIFHAKRPF